MDSKPFTDKEWARFRKVYKLELAEKRKLTQREQDIQRARTIGPRGYTNFFRLVATMETLRAEREALLDVLRAAEAIRDSTWAVDKQDRNTALVRRGLITRLENAVDKYEEARKRIGTGEGEGDAG